jgi:hypothetical protein
MSSAGTPPKTKRARAGAGAAASAGDGGCHAAAAAAVAAASSPAKRARHSPAAGAAASAAAAGPAADAAAIAVAAGHVPSRLAQLQASTHMLTLIDGNADERLDVKFRKIAPLVQAEWQRVINQQPRLLDCLLDWSMKNALHPGGGTLLTAVFRLLKQIYPEEGDSAERKREKDAAWTVADKECMPYIGSLFDDVPYVDSLDNGWTALQLFCYGLESSNPDGWICSLVKRLVECGADLNARNPAGAAPLHDWVRAGARTASLFLLDLGADINVADSDGDTLAHILADIQLSPVEFDKFVSSNHFARADLSLRNKDGLTAVQVAQQKLAELRNRQPPPLNNDAEVKQQMMVTQMLAALADDAAARAPVNRAAAAAVALLWTPKVKSEFSTKSISASN